METVSLQDFPEDTYVFLEERFRNSLFHKLEEKYGSLRIAGIKLGIIPAELYFYKLGFTAKKTKKVKRYIPLDTLQQICDDLGINFNDLQERVVELKTSSRSGIIENPKLPLKIKPETFAILGHFLGDGYGGEKGNSCYVNKSNEALHNFIEKLKIAFGDVDYSVTLKHNRVVVSKLVPKILKKYFGIEDFRGSKSNLTEKVFNVPKECLVELVKAVIIDEGRVADSCIEIEFSSNPKLTQDFKRICEEKLGYVCGTHKNNFFISHESFDILKQDMKNLIIPEKQKMFQKWFDRKKRKWYNRKTGQTKKEIVRLLLDRPMTVKELASQLGVRNESVRMQIKGYSKNGRKISGLLHKGVVKVMNNKAWKNTDIFEISDKDKALNFLGVEND